MQSEKWKEDFFPMIMNKEYKNQTCIIILMLRLALTLIIKVQKFIRNQFIETTIK